MAEASTAEKQTKRQYLKALHQEALSNSSEEFVSKQIQKIPLVKRAQRFSQKVEDKAHQVGRTVDKVGRAADTADDYLSGKKEISEQDIKRQLEKVPAYQKAQQFGQRLEDQAQNIGDTIQQFGEAAETADDVLSGRKKLTDEDVKRQLNRLPGAERVQRTQHRIHQAQQNLITNVENIKQNIKDDADVQAFQKIIMATTRHKKIQAIKESIQGAIILRGGLASGRFQAFIFALCLAVTKDIIDIPAIASANLVGSMLSLVVTISLFIIITFQGVFFQRMVAKFAWRIIIVAALGELIPFVEIFPFYTISVLLIRRKAIQTIANIEASIDAIEKSANTLSR